MHDIAVIFDLDGLLADTERLHCRAYRETLAAAGHLLGEAEYAEHWVRTGRGIDDWIAQHGLSLDPAAIRREKAGRYLAFLAAELTPMPGAMALLELCYRRMPLALASSSYRDAVDGVLHGLGIARFFQTVVCGLDAPRVKPAPDLFLMAAARLKIEPRRCVVLEDAEKGVLAAAAAGMPCIAVPNVYTAGHDFSKATRICASLSELTPDILAGLVE